MVAPGPFWTPLQSSGGQPQGAVMKFGEQVPLGRPGQRLGRVEVDHQRPVRLDTDHQPVQRIDAVAQIAAGRALIDPGRIGKAVSHHPGAAVERRADGPLQMVAAPGW